MWIKSSSHDKKYVTFNGMPGMPHSFYLGTIEVATDKKTLSRDQWLLVQV